MIKFRITWAGPQGLGMSMASRCAYLESPVLPRVGEYVKFNEDVMDPKERGPECGGFVTSVMHYFQDGVPSFCVVVK